MVCRRKTRQRFLQIRIPGGAKSNVVGEDGRPHNIVMTIYSIYSVFESIPPIMVWKAVRRSFYHRPLLAGYSLISRRR